MRGVEVRVMFVRGIFEHVKAARVDHRSTQTFGKSGFPVRAAVAMSQIAYKEPSLPNPYAQLIVAETCRLSLVQALQVKARKAHLGHEVVADHGIRPPLHRTSSP